MEKTLTDGHGRSPNGPDTAPDTQPNLNRQPAGGINYSMLRQADAMKRLKELEA